MPLLLPLCSVEELSKAIMNELRADELIRAEGVLPAFINLPELTSVEYVQVRWPTAVVGAAQVVLAVVVMVGVFCLSLARAVLACTAALQLQWQWQAKWQCPIWRDAWQTRPGSMRQFPICSFRQLLSYMIPLHPLSFMRV